MPITQLNNPNNALNSFFNEQLTEFQQVKGRLKNLEIGTNIYHQLVLANNDQINYLEARVNQLENQVFYLEKNLKKRLISVEYSFLFLGSILVFSGIIKLCYWLLTKPKKTADAKVERNQKGQFTKLKK